MKYEPSRFEVELRTEALSQAIMYVSNHGGDVIAWAERFYLFLSAKSAQPISPPVNPFGSSGTIGPIYPTTYTTNTTNITPTP